MPVRHLRPHNEKLRNTGQQITSRITIMKPKINTRGLTSKLRQDQRMTKITSTRLYTGCFLSGPERMSPFLKQTKGPFLSEGNSNIRNEKTTGNCKLKPESATVWCGPADPQTTALGVRESGIHYRKNTRPPGLPADPDPS